MSVYKISNKNYSKHFSIKIFLLYMIITTSLIYYDSYNSPLVSPQFNRYMETMRPVILEAAQRHNHHHISRMNDKDFAVVMSLILYNEHSGWAEDIIPSLRRISPIYQGLQISSNELIGTNLSVRPTNLRPSVGLEILQNQIPVKGQEQFIIVPLTVHGSNIQIKNYTSKSKLYTEINNEIIQPDLSIEYLAVNLERGLYRSEHEGINVSWRTLVAWHIRGVVSPRDIQENKAALAYTRRTTYLKTACLFIYDSEENMNDSSICSTN